jgi:response regulator RpfG family c-di-GMP phosphodiesterase
VPQEVIGLIRLHDELFSGKGFPKNIQGKDIPELVRAFSLFNHFDHYRLAASGTRRARFDQAKQKMTARKTDYDPGLWPKFWLFWENSVEAIS